MNVTPFFSLKSLSWHCLQFDYFWGKMLIHVKEKKYYSWHIFLKKEEKKDTTGLNKYFLVSTLIALFPRKPVNDHILTNQIQKVFLKPADYNAQKVKALCNAYFYKDKSKVYLMFATDSRHSDRPI